MLRSYEAILDHDHVSWVKGHPPAQKTRVLVTVLQSAAKISEPNGTKLASFLRSRGNVALTEKFGDPVIWQREQRRGRTLPGRE